jgi:small conductance mechanosensitive channel
MNADLLRYLKMAQDWAVLFVPKVILAVVVLYVGMRVIKKINELVAKSLKTGNIDATISPFISSMVNLGLKFALVLMVATTFGFDIASVLTLISALAFAVGLALQGSLGHFASGILLLLLKPYKVGDEVKIGETEGFVDEIQVFNTIIRTRDHRHVIIPNGVVTSGTITNLTGLGNRRVDMVFVVDEPNSVAKVKMVIQRALDSCPLIVKDMPTELFLQHFTTDELHFAVRPWCKADDYWKVWDFVQEAVKNGFDETKMTGNVHYVQLVQGRDEVTKIR